MKKKIGVAIIGVKIIDPYILNGMGQLLLSVKENKNTSGPTYPPMHLTLSQTLLCNLSSTDNKN